MSAAPKVFRSPVFDYSAAGFKLCRIAPNSKSPTGNAWNHHALPPDAVLADGEGVGLLLAFSGLLSLDIDAIERATAMLTAAGIDLQALRNDPASVHILSGKPGRDKLLFRMPMGMAMPTVQVGDGKKMAYELRCADRGDGSVQDVLPVPTHNHPDTGKPYAWQGDWHNIPEAPAELLAHWLELLSRRDGGKPPVDPDPTITPEMVRDMLATQDADCDRKTWIGYGMAVQQQLGDPGFQIWNEWSATATRKGEDGKPLYPGERDAWQQYRSFRADKQGGITIATLIKAAGWQRPMPDMKFGPVPEPEPKEWSEPKGDEMMMLSGLPHPRLDMTVLPPVLSNAARIVAESVGCDPMVSVAAGMIAVCAAADNRSSLIVKKGMAVPPILRAMPIGNASDSKSPGSKPMFAILEQLEKEGRDNHKAEMLKWQGEEARHAGDMKYFKEWQQSPDSHLPNAVPPAVQDLPDKPARVRLKTNNVSTAKALGLLADRPYGMAYILDDGSEWLKGLVNPNRYDDPDVYLQTYEGGPYNLDRVEGGETYIQNAALSMYVNAHPDTLYAIREKLSRHGALQRFIPIPLDTSITNPGGEPDGYDEAMLAWSMALRKIYGTEPRAYHLDPDGALLWQSFKVETTKLKKDLQAMRHSNYLVGYAGKLDGLAARVALVFHLLTSPMSDAVPVETLSNAIIFCRYALRCAAFLDNAHMGTESKEAWVVNHIVLVSGTESSITLSSIIRSGRREFDDMPKWAAIDTIRNAMEMLCESGWCALMRDDAKTTVWNINPKLDSMFKERREKMIRIRAEIVKKISGRE